jgi:hypothetical protein
MNIAKMLKQAASLRKDMEKAQAQIAEQRVEFSSGAGMVKAVARGDMTIESITIDPRVVDPADVEMLQDLVCAAVDGALKAAKELAGKEMSRLTSGLGLSLPGM